jgi:hypothetical protein
MKSLTICLSPQEVEQRLARLGIFCSFSAEERAALTAAPLIDRSERTLVFPIPADNHHLNLHHIKSCVGTDRRKQPCFFDHPWYGSEDFMRTNCEAGWHAIMMDVLEGSIEQPLNYLDSLKDPDLLLPSAIEIVLMLFLHYVGTGEQLLLKKHSWCSDLASLGRHVTVGAFGRNGVFISGHPQNFASRGLGVCAKVDRKTGLK